MNPVRIIERKRDGYILSNEEIQYMISEYMMDHIPEYQMSAFLMAVYFQNLNDDELYFLTKAMVESGVVFDLTDIKGICADKHSTGGVGDKTTLVLGPMLVACGLVFAKLSGRGLAHTGGTLDKLESIPNMNITLSEEEFLSQIKEINIAIAAQSQDMVPADKKMYALRDVSGTVPSIALIAASIISKKVAAGTNIILLDVKYGDGAFMKTKEDAEELAEVMIRLGKRFHRNISVEITNMNEPLGYAIGNALEVKEACETLQNKGPKDLTALCISSCASILMHTGKYRNLASAKEIARKSISDGSAYNVFLKVIEKQGGDISVFEDMSYFTSAQYHTSILADKNGYIESISCCKIGMICCELGAGRVRIEDSIDHLSGIVLQRKCTDYVSKKDVLCVVYSSSPLSQEMYSSIQKCFIIGDRCLDKEPLIYKSIL